MFVADAWPPKRLGPPSDRDHEIGTVSLDRQVHCGQAHLPHLDEPNVNMIGGTGTLGMATVGT